MALPQGALAQLAAINPDGKPRIIHCDDDDYLIVVQKTSGIYMVEQTDPDKLKALLHADDGAGDPQTLLVDGNKSLQVGQFSGDEWEIKQQTPADMMVAQHQYTGAGWVKSNLLFGYNDRWSEQVSDTNVDAGFNKLESASVGSGYVYVAVAAWAHDADNAPSQLDFGLYDGSIYHYFRLDDSPSAGVATVWSGMVVFKEGDLFRARFFDCTVGDDIYTGVLGYKMKLDM